MGGGDLLFTGLIPHKERFFMPGHNENMDRGKLLIDAKPSIFSLGELMMRWMADIKFGERPCQSNEDTLRYGLSCPILNDVRLESKFNAQIILGELESFWRMTRLSSCT